MIVHDSLIEEKNNFHRPAHQLNLQMSINIDDKLKISANCQTQ